MERPSFSMDPSFRISYRPIYFLERIWSYLTLLKEKEKKSSYTSDGEGLVSCTASDFAFYTILERKDTDVCVPVINEREDLEDPYTRFEGGMTGTIEKGTICEARWA